MITFETINETGRHLAETLRPQLADYEGTALVFIGSLGICVRRIKDLIHDKHSDPAVVCIDTTGRYVIPVLSGHVGGANDLARRIARLIGGQAIITTQSDNMGLWALDTLARQYSWQQAPLTHEALNQAIALFVNQHPTALVVEANDKGTAEMLRTLPEHVTVFPHWEEFRIQQESSASFELVILVSPRLYPHPHIPVIQYFPPCLHLGVGCQYQTPVEAARPIVDALLQAGYAPEAVASLSTIELKRDEPLLQALQAQLPQATLHIYDSETLQGVEVPHPSQKVYEVTGCYGVAEASALVACVGGELVLPKQKGSVQKDGSPCHYTFALGQNRLRGGHIEIVGAGPGDPDLISVRGRRLLEEADLILYAGSLVPRELTYCAKSGATVRSSADMNLEEQFALMKEYYDRGQLVVRLHTGDPCIYGAIQEQMAFFDQHHMHYHITPGISSFLAAAAELQSQFTIPERCQTIILTRGEGQTPMPDKEQLHLLASHQSTMCIFLSATLAEKVQAELLAGGYPADTPVAVCHKLTWKEQQIYRGTLSELAHIIRDHHLTLTTMIVVGEAIDNRKGLSKLYDKHFTHLFRKAEA